MARQRTSRWSLALFPALALAIFLFASGAPWSAVFDDGAQQGDRHADAPQQPGDPSLRGTAPNGPAARAPADDADDEPTTLADEAEDAVDDATMRRGLRLTVDHPDVAPVIAVQRRHERRLLSRPKVVGVATCLDARGDVAILVLTTEPMTGLPRFLDGVPVVHEVSGPIVASKGGPPADKGGGGGGGGKETVDTTARFDRPVPIGVSTGHPSITAGTIGCRVTDGTNVFALSNNHVYAASNGATTGDAVIQPGDYDGGVSPADDIGSLHDFVPLDFSGGDNLMDAAIASTSTGNLGAATPSDGYGTPKSTPLAAAFNLQVIKYGRTTGETSGKVYALNATVNVGYGAAGTATFTGQVIITPGTFSAGGDSGSLIVGKKGQDARKPVALLFAGSTQFTIGTPIDVVLDEFGVSIDGE